MAHLTPKLNIVFLFLLIITLIAGSYAIVGFVGGVEISAFRFILALTVAYLFFTKQLIFYTNRFSRWFFYIFICWFLYGLASLIWTPELIYGIKELSYLVIGAFTVFTFLSFSHFEKNFASILEKILIVSFIIVSGLFVYEMITQQHLPGEYTDKLQMLGDFHRSNIIPVFTFVNPNVAAIYLCVCMVFSAWCLIDNRNKVLHSAIILVAFNFLLLLESRLGVLSVVGSLSVTLLLLMFRRVRSKISIRFNKREAIALLVIIGLNGVVLYSEFEFLKTESIKLHKKSGGIDFEIAQKVSQRTRDYGQVLLTSNVNHLKTDSACLVSDKVFMIQKSAYLKLLDQESVQLQFKPINGALYKKMFISGTNLLLVVSIFLLNLVLVITFIFSFRLAKNRGFILLTVGGILAVVLLSWNSYQYPWQGYKKYVLVEKGFNADNLQKSDLSTVSTDFRTGSLLQSTKTAHIFLSRNPLVGPGGKSDNQKISSSTIRKNLFLNGLHYLKGSNYMGVGAGGFLASNMKKLNKHPDGGVGGAHNFIIEILSQYGIIIFTLLSGVFASIILILVRGFRKGEWSAEHFLVLWLFIFLIFMGNANSSFLSLPMNWLLVAFLVIFANRLIVEERPNETKD